MNFTALGVRAEKTARTVTIDWADGHQSIYPFFLVRAACPCAMCKGGHENMRQDPDPQVFQLSDSDTPKNRVKSLAGVGQYALSFEWEDGHHFGIYTWEYLRKLCPCAECRRFFGTGG